MEAVEEEVRRSLKGLKSGAQGGGEPVTLQLRDGVRVRAFESEDNSTVLQLERMCLRGGVSVGAYTASESIEDKAALYESLVTVVAERSNVQYEHVSTDKLKPATPVRLNSGEGLNDMDFKETRVVGFAAGAIEKVGIDSGLQRLTLGTVIDCFVLEALHRRNIASRMYQVLETEMKTRNMDVACIKVASENKAPMSLFKKHGFQPWIHIEYACWSCAEKQPLDASIKTHLVLDTDDQLDSFLRKFKRSFLCPTATVLAEVFFGGVFNGGTVFAESSDGQSTAQVSIMSLYALYNGIVAKEPPKMRSILERFACMSPNPEVIIGNPCVLYGAACHGPEAAAVLANAIAYAHNQCQEDGSVLLAMPYQAGSLALDVLPKLLLQRESAVILAKPVLRQVPSPDTEDVFIDPRW